MALTGKVTAQPLKIPPYPVILHQQHTNLDRIFNAIQEQSAARFSYDRVAAQKIIVGKVDYINTPLNEVLGHLKQFAKLSYKADGNEIIVYIGGAIVKETSKDTTLVSGKIIDNETGDPVVSATITIGNRHLLSNEEGAFTVTLPWGEYIAEISSIGYGTKKVSGIRLHKIPYLELNITLNRNKDQLAGVVVTSSARKEGIASHFLRQKNAASLTDGISAEQIARTPDNNMGQVLKRVTGIATVDDRYVVVRGLTDRYNQGMIDGVVLPSTKMNRRDFSFDAIPQEVVSNVVVNKTATPELSAEFSGGQISVNTLDIPNDNFTIIGLGLGYNSQSTGKDFYRLGRWGKYDFLGFDDGSRKLPGKILSWQFAGGGANNALPPPGNSNEEPGTVYDGDEALPYNSLDAIAQSKKIDPAGLKPYRYTTLPLYNGRVVLGRIYKLPREWRIGFTAGLSLRNNQTIVPFNNVRGYDFSVGNPLDTLTSATYKVAALRGTGMSYRHSSTLGTVLNAGLQNSRFKLGIKNIFTSVLNDDYNERLRYDESDLSKSPIHYFFQQPELTQVRQHLLEGSYKFAGDFNLEYGASITKIRQEIRDQRILQYGLITVDNIDYYQSPLVGSPLMTGVSTNLDQPQRLWTVVKETDYNWKAGFNKLLGEGTNITSLLKLGYNGWQKTRPLQTNKLNIFSSEPAVFYAPYATIMRPENMGVQAGQTYYFAEAINSALFEGKLKNHSVYAMADQKFFKKLRFVYGFRAEYFNLGQKDDEFLKKKYKNIPDWAYRPTYFNGKEIKEKDWRLLPSANLVYSLTPQINIRGAYSRTAIRPDFRESSYFGMYDYELNATVTGKKLVSTIVDNMDLRFEWYPSATEIFTIGGFYKYLDKPIELMADPSFPASTFYRFVNQVFAKNYGLEMEFRKSMGFLAPATAWFDNIIVFGNGSFLKSEVSQSTYPVAATIDDKEAWTYFTDSTIRNRPLLGQVPWMVNAGIMYQGDRWGITASYNRAGYRTNLVNKDPNLDEYEQGRNLLDLQIYARFFSQKMEVKLNCSNLLNEYRFYYQNLKAFETSREGMTQVYRLTKGSLRYEKDKGDRITYRERQGRNFSLAVSYRF